MMSLGKLIAIPFIYHLKSKTMLRKILMVCMTTGLYFISNSQESSLAMSTNQTTEKTVDPEKTQH